MGNKTQGLLLYPDVFDAFKGIEDNERRGVLIMACIDYFEKRPVVFEDAALALLWCMVRPQIDRAVSAYERRSAQCRDARGHRVN